MLVLPIVSGGKVLNVQVRLKNVEKIRTHVSYDDACESEIIVNREKFSESTFKDSKDASAPIDFIRSKSMLYPRDFLVTTKEERDSTMYDVYKVGKPPKQVNKKLDKLYSRAINDLRKEIPDSKESNSYKAKGRVVSLEDLGLLDTLTTEKLATLRGIVKEEDTSAWPKLFEEAGIADIPDTINFINNFEFIVLSDYTIPEKEFQNVLKLLGVINSREYRNMNKFYKTGKTNSNIFERIDIANKMLYSKPIKLYERKEKPKQYVKKDERYAS